MTAASPVPIVYFSDVLCIWAYIAQLRVDEINRAFGEQVRFEKKFCSVFGATARKIPTTWKDKGGYEGFNAHLRHAAAQFPEISIDPDIWLDVRPASSTGAHLYLKAVQLDETAGGCPSGTAQKAVWALRRAFFEDARDIARRDVQREIAAAAGADVIRAEALIDDGSAFAALAGDYQDAEAAGIVGSPTFVLNDGRQKLYGNVAYRVIEANVQELLRSPSADQASWC
jgi:predicted DsbA family dithiol-disulfide isomerase